MAWNLGLVDDHLIMKEKERHVNLRNILGTLAWWDTWRDKGGIYRLVSQVLPAETGIFARTPAGCAKDTRLSRIFCVIFSYENRAIAPDFIIQSVSTLTHCDRVGQLQNRKTLKSRKWKTIGKKNKDFLFFASFSPIFAYLSYCLPICLPILWILGLFLFCCWPTQSQH